MQAALLDNGQNKWRVQYCTLQGIDYQIIMMLLYVPATPVMKTHEVLSVPMFLHSAGP